ncbi:GTPase IMAP family member 8-like protein [Labeo rohita]|uniref:GTPase IMAP family member 8-like protein n=1 Tax=Labeo rohita TaxID=84645 RepID=A0A498NQ83_LABRO|nr:GTPase IMAP family member 8-like protein [Labeo rohita]
MSKRQKKNQSELRAVLIGQRHSGKTSVINTILETSETETEGSTDDHVKREGTKMSKRQKNNQSELRAVLIGHRHSGRTSVINTILETSETETEGSTDDHVKREGFVDGRKVSLVETPGCWKTFNPRDLSIISKQQLLRRISLISPGPHAVLIVIRADSQFTDIDGSFLEEYVELLGPNIWTHTIVIFTRGDLIKREDIEQHIQEDGSALKRLIEKCENKYHIFNNSNHQDRTQVKALFRKIKGIVEKNNGKHFDIDLEKVKEVNEQWEENQTRVSSRKSRVQKERSEVQEKAYVRRLEEIRVVLLGWVLCGKSAAGNTILNRDEFDTGGRTGVGLWGFGDVDGRKMTVLDTPGWWKYIESELNPDFIRSAILESDSEFGDQDKPPDDPLNVIGTLQQDNIPEPIKTLLEREFSRWETIIIDGVRDSLQDIKSSFELRAVLIGRRQSGKTSVINTILETSETETEGSTDEHVKREGFVDGRKVSLVETPGWWKTFNLKDLSNISKQQLLRRISLISPGPHAVLIVIRGDSPFTDTDRSFLEEYVELLGPNVWTHTIVIFTRGDLRKQEDIEQHIWEDGSALKQFIEKCENKYHVFNNSNHQDQTQVKALFKKIEGIVEKNNGKHFDIDLEKVKKVNEQWEENQTRASSRKSRVQKERSEVQEKGQDKPPDDPLNVIDTLQQDNIPEPIKTLLEREFSRWETIIIDGVRDSLQDIKSSFELSQAEKRQKSLDAVERWLQNYNHYVQHTIDKIQDPESGIRRKRLKIY